MQLGTKALQEIFYIVDDYCNVKVIFDELGHLTQRGEEAFPTVMDAWRVGGWGRICTKVEPTKPAEVDGVLRGAHEIIQPISPALRGCRA